MKHVLIIAHHYPPIGNVGGIRTKEFAKHLPSFGWKPYVLTIANPDKKRSILTSENKKSEEKIIRTRSLLNLWNKIDFLQGTLNKTSRFLPINQNIIEQLIIPDPFIGWVPLTLLKTLKITKKEKIDLIYISCPPYSPMLIGWLAKKITKKPVVIDYRDSWKTKYESFNPLIRKTLKNIEGKILRKTDMLILNTPSAYNQYKNDLLTPKSLIPNGYDKITPTEKTKKFILLHTGSLYSKRSPDLLFKALKNTKGIKFIQIGYQEKLLQLAQKYKVPNKILIKEHEPHEKALEEISKATLLYLQQHSEKAIPAKTYEYLASGKPILAITPEGDTAELIRKYSPHSHVITTNKEEDIRHAILDAYKKWKKNKLPNKIHPEFKRKYNRKKLTRKLAKIFDASVKNT